ncbi:hypothetical protein E2986_02881 [Frieseomelitta varia]|uniref:Disks large-associated protein 1 n=1 Tax=Frieseomelitta varia TaxID=561572 RepID=A0A833W0N3_9HYME|nr:hypothetical protein E2986_02881 [Frieseomelitta varia]
MTSQESIGSCSLDVDQSASDRSENTIDTISKKTLHSLNLSCNGDSVSSPENLANGSSETLQKSHLSPDEKLNVSNGHRSSPEPEQLTVKKPSYLGLACSISGYSGINRYDSKLREGFRSRDSSPGTRLITRDTSPAAFRSNENLNVPAHPYPPKSQSISPLAMDRQNGFSNGLKEECKVETYRESRSSMGIYQGYSEVDKGVLHSTYPDVSPVQASTPMKRSPGISQMMSCSQQNKHFSVSPKQPTVNHIYIYIYIYIYSYLNFSLFAVSNASSSFSDTSILNGTTEQVENQTTNSSTSSEKSFIQQRVERLYGPGALAQGFFFRRSTSKLSNTDSSFNKSNSNNNDVSTENANTEESLKNLPVLRHLRPEFRAQLPVVSPRRPTDGSEQVLKPLQRVTPVSRKAEQKPKIPAAKNLDGNLADSGAQKLNSSVTSIPDQQPAAPKVVLPVLEPSASSTNVAKQVQEAEKTVEEKNGHYFMKLLKQETDRLLSLAASTEAELASCDTVALPEEAAGKLRSAAGKARLLASQKMQQFEGLCQKNINQVPGEEFPTTSEDLAGFWDMVMLQVVQVNELFDQIEKLRNSQWQEVRSVSVHPQTIDRLKPSEKNSHSHDNSDNVTSAELPSRRSYSHSLTNKRVRSNDATFNNPEDFKNDSYNPPIAEQFALEMRLCDDAFQPLTVPRNIEENENYCEDYEVDYVCENITEIQSIKNDSFPLNPRASYVVNYVNKLQRHVNSFYFENYKRPSCHQYPRDDSLERRRSSKFEVLFEKEDVEVKQRGRDYSFDKPRGDYSESIANDGGKIAQEKENNASSLKTTFSSHKGTDKKVGQVRSKAKSCSPAGRRSPNQKMQETLRQLRQIYNVENQTNLSSATVNRSVKLERMKVYDKRRKKVFKAVVDKPSKKVISNHLDDLSENNFIKQLHTRDANARSLRDSSEATCEIVNPTSENHDFSTQCLISLTNLTPCVVNNKNESTLVVNNITNNIPTWSEGNDEIRNFLSTLISSMSSEIASKVTMRNSSKSEKRVKKLSYGLITRNIKSSNVSANVITDVSQNVRSVYIFQRLFQTVPEKKTVASTPQNGTTAKRRVAPIHKSKSTANSEANKKAREAREQARRQLIEERRRAMRSNAQNSENTVKIFAPDT